MTGVERELSSYNEPGSELLHRQRRTVVQAHFQDEHCSILIVVSSRGVMLKVAGGGAGARCSGHWRPGILSIRRKRWQIVIATQGSRIIWRVPAIRSRAAPSRRRAV